MYHKLNRQTRGICKAHSNGLNLIEVIFLIAPLEEFKINYGNKILLYGFGGRLTFGRIIEWLLIYII
jgi:hypothetical protein